MDDLNKAFNHLFGFKVPIDDYDEFEKKVEEAREIKEHLDKVEILKDIPQIITPVKMTNYDHIKSMSVEEMAEWIVGLKLVFECYALGGDAHEVVSKLNNSEKKELDHWLGEEKATYKQWLLQEVSDEK